MNSTNSEKSTRELEAEVDESRQRMDNTISSIRKRFSPGSIIDDTLEYMGDGTSGDMGQKLASTAKDNPLPLMLMAVGAGWLAFSAKGQENEKDDRYSDIDARTPQHATNNISTRSSSSSDTSDSTDDFPDLESSSVLDSTKRKSRKVGRKVSTKAKRAKSSFDDTYQQQPLLVGGVAVALGALCAMLLPATRKEDELLGESSDKLVDLAAEKAEKQAVKANEKIESSLDNKPNSKKNTANEPNNKKTKVRS